MQYHDLIILADFNLAVGLLIRQTAKLNSSPNFPAILWLCTKTKCTKLKHMLINMHGKRVVCSHMKYF